MGNCGQSQLCVEETCLVVLQFFLGMREVVVFPKRRPSQAVGLLGSFSQANPLFFLWEKHSFSISAFSFPIWNKRKLFKILFKFWLNLFSQFGMQGGNYCGLLPCKRTIHFVLIWGRGCWTSFQKLSMKEWVCFVLSRITYFKKFSEIFFPIP